MITYPERIPSYPSRTYSILLQGISDAKANKIHGEAAKLVPMGFTTASVSTFVLSSLHQKSRLIITRTKHLVASPDSARGALDLGVDLAPQNFN